MFKGLDTKLNFSIAYHPQMDGQIEIVNQVLEYMLSMYVKDHPKKWEEYMHLPNFSYNNNYRSLGKLSPFEILYHRNCSTTIPWINKVDILMLGPDLLKEIEQIMNQVQSNKKIAHDKQKSHVDLKITKKEFHVGEHVFVKVKARKFSFKLGSCAKLEPRFLSTI